MITSSEDARLLFTRWVEDSSPLRIRFRSATLIFEGAGVVQSFDSNVLNLGGDSWQLVVPLTAASFTFSDPREAPVAAVREAEASRYEFGLAVELASGDRLALMEMKVADAEPASEESE
jgi:hypothetical protein